MEEEKYLKPNNFVFQWHLTERCNWRCKHCYQEWDKMPSDLSLEQLFKIFDNYLFLLTKWQVPPHRAYLNITGGEPFVRNDFFDFLKKVGEYSRMYRWGILSNGSLLTPENIAKLKEYNISSFQVSMEGMEKNNDEIRGKGSFQKTVESIKMLVNARVPVRVSFTLTQKNVEDVPSLAKLLQKLRTHGLGTRRLIPWGAGEELREYMLTPLQLRDFYMQVKEINKKLAKKGEVFRIVIGCESGIFTENILADPESDMRPNICGVTEGRVMVIMANGDIFPCRRFPIKVGNALQDSLFDVYYSKQMREFRDLDKLHPFCQKCPNFTNCFGGARCVTYAYTQKWNIPDVQCWRVYKDLNKPNF